VVGECSYVAALGARQGQCVDIKDYVVDGGTPTA
jgi:hypothetical protein